MEQQSSQATMVEEPTPLAALLTWWLGSTIGSYWYRRQVAGYGLKGNERVLDFGSGAGTGSKYLAKALKNGRLTCVDISRRWLGIARRRLQHYGNVDFQLGDICSLPLPDGFYDGIVVSFVLHDIPEAQRAQKLKCLVGKLKRGGRIYLTEPVSSSHGMQPGEVCDLMAGAEMVKERSALIKVPTMGSCFDATYVKG